MAIQLSERAITATIDLLKANLATELAAIVTEFGDGITLPAPVNASGYYNRPKSEIQGDDAHVEVFEDPFEFRHPYSDAAANRATYDLEIVVRVTVINREAVDAETMYSKMRRYSAAVVRIVLDNPQLDAGPEVQVAKVVRVDPYHEIEGEDEEGYQKVSTAVALEVSLEECT